MKNMNSLLLSIPVFIAIIVYIFLTIKKKHYVSLLIAFLISLSWTFYYGYNYKGTNLYLLGKINVFALLAWTAGLMILFQVFLLLQKKFGSKWKALGLSHLVYLALLFPMEWFGYNVLEIQMTSSFHGLFNLELIHGTTTMKVYYVLAGGLYILLLILIGQIKDEDSKNEKH